MRAMVATPTYPHRTAPAAVGESLDPAAHRGTPKVRVSQETLKRLPTEPSQLLLTCRGLKCCLARTPTAYAFVEPSSDGTAPCGVGVEPANTYYSRVSVPPLPMRQISRPDYRCNEQCSVPALPLIPARHEAPRPIPAQLPLEIARWAVSSKMCSQCRARIRTKDGHRGLRRSGGRCADPYPNR